ncbi:LamG-like jellyroll fold domain-containing protein [Aurantibacillus circumpalustris]|uniref:LamG-like jellyroll fold domain-containing protein n=1 Tax=Aurantibacillus circumpalustris TaxID=3036359 RepID=UPI00295A9922|nr:LamG-like jellyroll fold domain-containing protein [Aurantibacillus circumpalustris]
MKNNYISKVGQGTAKNLNRFINGILLAFLLLSLTVQAQSVGDTIVVKAFKYGSTTRDTSIQFPPSNLTFEKIILKYNMRCKNNLVSTQTAPNQGCGEWDYSCNTYIVDSTKIETELNTTPKYVISNFSGNTFSYTSIPLFDYYNFAQTQVVVNNIVSENQYTVGVGNTAVPNLLKTNERSGHSQILYTAAELTGAGLSAGNIDGILLNVANSGGAANFLKLGIQHTSQTNLNSGAVTLAGFTNVHNANYLFANGSNRVQFHTPFVWNGTSNVLIDYSFTNTGLSSPIILNGAATTFTSGLYANNNYALDLSSSGHVTINSSVFSSINNEITISFWAFGTASLMPTGTSIVYSTGANGSDRNLNIHLPWTNNDIYFDCGFANGGFDRIQKTAIASEQGGQWNHWAFTKNAVTGNMTIYLNGTLWMSGTGKTNPISILNLILGKNTSLLNNYKGKVNEFTIWNKELSQTDVANWMNKPIDATHPFYTNLLAYYKMNEGSGLIVNDTKNTLTSTGVYVQWTYDRGNKLDRMFYETNIRPNIVFLRGTYALTTTSVTVKDSVGRNPNIVQEFSITSNATAIPMAHDIVSPVSTVYLYAATPLNIYNGDTGQLTGTIAVNSQSTIAVTTLNYYKRFPFYNEIMSFVTPYGKGLNLGVDGKTWYYDVSDFAPVLKGKKRFMMTLGGEYQEQMDIDFWFIVGTPPRTVVEFNQLWQGAARIGGSSIASVNNDTRFPTLNVPIISTGEIFKVRSTITGHGSHGEFGQNGGVITHYLNMGGGPNEFSWPITMKCGFIPVFPQGGTWIYTRQGWCPGQTSLLTENYITQYVTPGTTASIDYNCSNPPIPSGDYRYIAAHQLISYGPANHTNDAAIIDVLAPSTKVMYSRTNPMCANPVVLIQNTGLGSVTSVDIDYWLNNSSQKQTYQWVGNLANMDTVSILLPINGLWTNGLQPSNNMFNAEITAVNAVADDYSYNNFYHSKFILPDLLPNEITVEFKTNNNPYENNYKLFDENGIDVSYGTPLVTANTVYADNYEIYGCYKLVVQDAGGDGVQFWNNAAQGTGYVRIKNNVGTVLKTFQPDFGSGFEYSFSTTQPVFVGVKSELADLNIRVFPNPAHDFFEVRGENLQNCSVILTDLIGRSIEVPVKIEKTGLIFDTRNLNAGAYLISISKGNQKTIRKIIIY